MMALTDQEIKAIIKESAAEGKRQIPKSLKHEGRVKLHSATTVSDDDIREAFTDFCDFVKKLLNAEKYNMFLSLIRFPVLTVSLTDEIYTALHRIFDGRNPVFNFDFKDDSINSEWLEYLHKALMFIDKWKHEGFEVMKTAINSIVVVDMEQERRGPRPEPYFYFLNLKAVLDYRMKREVKEEGFDWLMFVTEGGDLAVLDDGFYRLYEYKDRKIGDIIIENPHDLGYCPARWFWTTPINRDNPNTKRSPLSNFLSKLDFLLFFEISNEHLNLYGRYPVYSSYSPDCEFESKENGNYCDGGYLRARDNMYLLNGGRPVPCPVCSQKRILGPGTFIEIQPPSRANNNADLSDPLKITGIDKDSLDFNKMDIWDRKKEIFVATTGYKGLPLSDQAVNEKQVFAIFESQESALQPVQENFESAMNWTASTIARLMYGPLFEASHISLGTEHFILTASQLMDIYIKAKESSFSPSALDRLENRYYATEYRNNPEQLSRQMILTNLIPFRHLTFEQVLGMFQGNQIVYADYMIQSNFSSLIMRFERENTKVQMFGREKEFDKRIELIKAELVKYVEEGRPGQSD